MKGKATVCIVTAAMAAAMCVGFVGCGASAESVKGEEVTEKQWNSALEYFTDTEAIYTIECTEEHTEERKCEYIDEILSGSVNGTQTVKVIKNGAKEYVKENRKIEMKGDYKKIAAALDQEIKTVDETEEEYAEHTETGYTVYYKNDDDKWAKRQSYSSIAYGKISEVLSNMGISLSYSSYEYSTNLKGYILKNSVRNDAVYIVKFNGDGKLSAIYFEYETNTKSSNREHGKKDVFNVLINYKGEKVNLPTVE